jgi:hypothetical protein
MPLPLIIPAVHLIGHGLHALFHVKVAAATLHGAAAHGAAATHAAATHAAATHAAATHAAATHAAATHAAATHTATAHGAAAHGAAAHGATSHGTTMTFGAYDPNTSNTYVPTGDVSSPGSLIQANNGDVHTAYDYYRSQAAMDPKDFTPS